MFSAKIIGVMACDKKGVVGNNGAIPWNYPEEFQHFRDTIGNYPIVLGRKSFELLPKSILKNRITIVFSREKKISTGEIIFVSSFDEFFALDILRKKDKIFMIGGAQLANSFLKQGYISEFILTKLNHSYIGNAVLNIKIFDNWKSEIIKRADDYNIYKLTIE